MMLAQLAMGSKSHIRGGEAGLTKPWVRCCRKPSPRSPVHSESQQQSSTAHNSISVCLLRFSSLSQWDPTKKCCLHLQLLRRFKR